MQPHKYLIALMVFGVIVTLALQIPADMESNLEDMGHTVPTIDTEKGQSYTKVREVQNKTEDIEDAVLGTDTGGEDAAVTFLGAPVSALKQVYNSVSISKELILNVGNLFGVPPIVVEFFTGALIITLLFTLVYMVMRYTGEK